MLEGHALQKLSFSQSYSVFQLVPVETFQGHYTVAQNDSLVEIEISVADTHL